MSSPAPSTAPLKTFTLKTTPLAPPSPAIALTSPQLLTSYNHLSGAKPPGLIVPGMPARWAPPHRPHALTPDTGVHYIDQSAARSPAYPFLPAVTALLHTHPTFSLADTHIVSCRNSLRRLLSFCTPAAEAETHRQRAWRFVARRAHGAVWLCRREEASSERIVGFRGYAAAFAEDSTVWEDGARVPGCETTSHHRVIAYDFAGLRCVVRFEVDGYIPGLEELPGSGSGAGPDVAATATDAATALASASIRPAAEVSLASSPPGFFTVHERGRLVPQSALFDIKTRFFRKPLPIEPLLPRAWISQTPMLVRGFWRSMGRVSGMGRFDDVRIEPLALREWEAESQEVLRRLRGLLGEIVRLAEEGGVVEVSQGEEGAELEVRIVDREEGEGEGVLPVEMGERLEQNAVQGTWRWNGEE